MLDHEEHIRRMQDEGLINDDQADLMSDAAKHAAAPVSPTSNRLRYLLPILIIVLMAMVALIFSTFGSEPEVIQDISQTLNHPGSTGNMNRTLNASLSIALILIVPLLAVA